MRHVVVVARFVAIVLQCGRAVVLFVGNFKKISYVIGYLDLFWEASLV